MLEEEKSGNCGGDFGKSGNGGNFGKSGNGGEGKWEMVGGFLLGRAGKGRWRRN